MLNVLQVQDVRRKHFVSWQKHYSIKTLHMSLYEHKQILQETCLLAQSTAFVIKKIIPAAHFLSQCLNLLDLVIIELYSTNVFNTFSVLEKFLIHKQFLLISGKGKTL